MGREGTSAVSPHAAVTRVVAAVVAMVMLVPAFAYASPVSWQPVGDRIVPPVASQAFGDMSMSGDGTFLAVASPSRFTGDFGEIFVYRRDGSDWLQVGEPVEGPPIDNYPSSRLNTAISDDGQTLMVGSPLANDQGGIARAYRFNGAEWRQIGDDVVGERPAVVQLGHDVAVSGDGSIVAVGAGGFNTAGFTTIFEIDGDELVQLGDFVVGEFQDFSSRKIDLSDDGRRLVAAADTSLSRSAGLVRVYEFDGAEWNQLGSTIQGDASRDRLGISVAISGDGTTIVAGAPRNDGGGRWAGQAKVFRYDGADWALVGADIYGEAPHDALGLSVAIDYDGSTVATGAPYNDAVRNKSGQVRIFELSGGEWAQVGADIDGERASESLGFWLDMTDDGATVAAGAFNFRGQGYVQVFSMADSTIPFVDGDVVFLVNEGSGRYLDGDGVHRSWNVDTSPDGLIDARWQLIDNEDGTWALLNRRRTRHLDADGSGAGWNVGQSVSISDDDRWEIISDDGAYLLRSVSFNRYLHQSEDNNVVTTNEEGEFSHWQIELVRG